MWTAAVALAWTATQDPCLCSVIQAETICRVPLPNQDPDAFVNGAMARSPQPSAVRGMGLFIFLYSRGARRRLAGRTADGLDTGIKHHPARSCSFVLWGHPRVWRGGFIKWVVSSRQRCLVRLPVQQASCAHFWVARCPEPGPASRNRTVCSSIFWDLV